MTDVHTMLEEMLATLTLALALTCPTPESLHGFEVQPVLAKKDSAIDYQIGALPTSLKITAVQENGEPETRFCGTATLKGVTDANGVVITKTPAFTAGTLTIKNVHYSAESISVEAGTARGIFTPALRKLPGWISLLPPLFAIGLAVWLRQAFLALFGSVWFGALFVYGGNPIRALARTFDTHLVHAVADTDHAAIILFTIALGGLSAILSRSGATYALVSAITKKATSRRAGQLTTWFGGLAVFIDDYANCLLVGSTVRPFTDKLRISREKLSYLVDSTAAPISTVAFVSTWIGFQLNLFADVTTDIQPYEMFLRALPYSFYPLITIFFVFLIAWTGRDYGPMLTAERRAVKTGELLRPGATPMMGDEISELAEKATNPPHFSHALLSILGVLGIVGVGLYVSGSANAPEGASFRTIVTEADAYSVLIWSSFGGSLIAMALALSSRSMNLEECITSWMTGAKAMLTAVAILILSWAIGSMCRDYLQTGPYIMSHFSTGIRFLPAMTFVICAVVSFATGSSFSTMGIVIPIAGPLAWSLTGDDSGFALAQAESIRFATLAAVLSGAVFGDHCSPISDTTIMSSMSCASDHVDHVRTQAPYALTCAGFALLLGFLPAGFGFSPWFSLALGGALCVAVIRLIGKPVVPSS